MKSNAFVIKINKKRILKRLKENDSVFNAMHTLEIKTSQHKMVIFFSFMFMSFEINTFSFLKFTFK